jgi:hypothetical protein
MKSTHGLLLALGCLQALAFTGCSSGPTMGDVQGTVTQNGKPLNRIQVEFWPEGDGPRSVAVTDDQGRYTLTTDDGKRKGAVIGSHRVLLREAYDLVGREAEDMDLSKGKKVRIPKDYSNSATTPLKKQVVAGSNDFPLEVK